VFSIGPSLDAARVGTAIVEAPATRAAHIRGIYKTAAPVLICAARGDECRSDKSAQPRLSACHDSTSAEIENPRGGGSIPPLATKDSKPLIPNGVRGLLLVNIRPAQTA